MADPKEIASKKYKGLFTDVLRALEETGEESYEVGKKDGIEITEQEYAEKLDEMKEQFDTTLRDKEQEYNSIMETYRSEIKKQRKEIDEAKTTLAYFMKEFNDVDKEMIRLEELPKISKKDIKKARKNAKKIMKKLQ